MVVEQTRVRALVLEVYEIGLLLAEAEAVDAEHEDVREDCKDEGDEGDLVTLTKFGAMGLGMTRSINN